MGHLTISQIDELLSRKLSVTENHLKTNLKAEPELIKGEFQSFKEELEEIKKENEFLRKKIQRMENRENRKNLIFRGIEEDENSNDNEAANLARIFGDFGCYSLDIKAIVINAFRIGKMKDKRHLKVEFNTVKDKNNICKWREELRSEGITISKDYSPKERKEYAFLRDIQTKIKTKLGVNSKIKGNRIEIYNKIYNSEDARVFFNDMLEKDGLDVISSPEAIVDGKRIKISQKQKDDRTKSKTQSHKKNRRRQSSPYSPDQMET